jgi:hypothetical protein
LIPTYCHYKETKTNKNKRVTQFTDKQSPQDGERVKSEMSCTLNIPQTMENVQEKLGVMNQQLPQTLGAVVSKVRPAETGGSRASFQWFAEQWNY